MIIVTGGSSGIGRAVLNEFKWVSSVNLSRSGTEPLEVYSTSIKTDVSNREQVEEAFKSISTNPKFSYHDENVLVCCAGIVEPKPFEELSADSWEEQVKVNLFGVVNCIREFIKYTDKGVIIIVSSTAGMRPSPYWSAYGASKAALINLALSLSEEFIDRFRVYCISPGRCATPLRKKLAPLEDPKTIMQPEEVAYTIKQLIVNDSRGLWSGQNIVVRKQS